MFWIGQLLALTAGLLGLGIARSWILKWPWAREHHIDWVLGAVMILGLGVATKDYLSSQEESKALEQQIILVRDYNDVAQLTLNGSPWIGGDIILRTPLTDIMSGTATRNVDGTWAKVCSAAALDKYRQAIAYNPKFPFSYYWLALCLKESGDSNWTGAARKAREIFKLTTQISGHHPEHDQALRHLNELLAQ